MCVDLDAYKESIELYGGLNSDESISVGIILLPCNKTTNPECEVESYRKNGKMDTDALWNRIGQPVIELFFREQRIDKDDYDEPIKTETTFHRSYMKKYVPSWAHSKI